MAYQGHRLRGGWSSQTPYPLGRIPDAVIMSVASNIVYSGAVGETICRAMTGATYSPPPLTGNT